MGALSLFRLKDWSQSAVSTQGLQTAAFEWTPPARSGLYHLACGGNAECSSRPQLGTRVSANGRADASAETCRGIERVLTIVDLSCHHWSEAVTRFGTSLPLPV
jgi:hypothetical protein